jgi:hypothetical protein
MRSNPSQCVTSGIVASGYRPDVLKQHIARAFSASHSLTLSGAAPAHRMKLAHRKALQHAD